MAHDDVDWCGPSLDVDDYDPDGQYIAVVPRPETGTTIKNGTGGECLIAVSTEVCQLLDDWIVDRRRNESIENRGGKTR